MGVAGAAEIFGAAAKFHDGGGFGDQFRGSVLQNVRSEDAIGFRIGDEFHHAVVIFIGDGATVGAKWKFADPIIQRIRNRWLTIAAMATLFRFSTLLN